MRMMRARALLTFFSSVPLPQETILGSPNKEPTSHLRCALLQSKPRNYIFDNYSNCIQRRRANTTSLHTCKWSTTILNGLTDSPPVVSMRMFVGRVSDHIGLSVDVAEHGSAWQRSQTRRCRGRGRGRQRGTVRLQSGGYQS